MVAALIGEARKVREAFLLEQRIGQRRLLAVEADDDQPPNVGRTTGVAAQEPPRRAKGPSQKGQQRQRQRRGDAEERRDQREAGAGPDVGLGRRGQQDHGACTRQEAEEVFVRPSHGDWNVM